MRKLLSVVCVLGLLSVFFSCKGKTEKDQIEQLLKEWNRLTVNHFNSTKFD